MEIRTRHRYLWIQYDILDLPDITGSDLLVYNVLARYANNETQKCYPSYKQICKMSHKERSTVSKSLKHLEEMGVISIDRKGNRVNHYTLLELPGGSKNELVQNTDTDSPKAVPVVVQKPYTNNTNNNTKFQAKYYKLENCSRGVQYAVEKLHIRPTESLVTLIDEQFKEYAVAPSINRVLAWCELKGKAPTTNTLETFLRGDLEKGILKEKRRS